MGLHADELASKSSSLENRWLKWATKGPERVHQLSIYTYTGKRVRLDESSNFWNKFRLFFPLSSEASDKDASWPSCQIKCGKSASFYTFSHVSVHQL